MSVFSLILFNCGCDNSTEPKDCAGVSGGDAFIDDCGVCISEESGLVENYLMDCAGICAGISQLDNCGICDDDESNDCLEDCANVWGGTAIVDDCGVCSGGDTEHNFNSDDFGCGCFNPAQLTYCYDADNDLLGSIGSEIDYCLQDLPDGWVIDCTDEDDSCMSNTYDCYDVCDGSAFIDDCGECIGGTTYLSENYLMDCSGECNGSQINDSFGGCCLLPEIDECGVCFGYNAAKDCWGDCFGDALLDNCGVCSGGNTGYEANSDMDCAGVCFGISYIDECGNCDDDPNNDCIQDCYGEWGGTAELDDCNICSGGSTHSANSDQDCAGECFGSSEVDCAGTCNGFALVDDCGVCDDNPGNDNSEMDCSGECFGTAYINNCENCVGGNTDLNENNCTVTDIDGNVYSTIIIGNQEWMAENLKVTHYRNGDEIPQGSGWGALTTGALCWYDYDWSHVETYGYLYNWYAVDDSRNIAPEGWHISTDEEWIELEIYLGMSQLEAYIFGDRGTDEGGKLKEVGTDHWNSPNNGATNETGFTALPGGYRTFQQNFNGFGWHGRFWTSSTFNNQALSRRLLYDTATINRYTANEKEGYSIRCVKDSE